LKRRVKFPEPLPGLVIRYSYLWHAEYLKGQEEGVKDRPCAVILVTEDDEGEKSVTVVPVTHTPPNDPRLALEIPAATKKRLGLDDARSWIVLTEANRFIWPGPDLRPMRAGDPQSVAYGLLPSAFYFQLRARFIAVIKSRGAGAVQRSE
jgi:hypothetical protein